MSRAARWLAIAMGTWRLLAGAPAREPAPPATGRAVQIEIKNVSLRFTRDLRLRINTLEGRMEPTGRGRPVTFDDKNSFVIDADYAETEISTQNLAHLLNDYVFAYPGAPLHNLTVAPAGTSLLLKGTLRKGVNLPFEIQGTLASTPDGNIRFHADKVHSGHLPVKGLLHLFGQNLSKLIHASEARGVRLEGDDIIMMPERMMPPPHIHGRVNGVRVAGDEIVLVFGSPGAATRLNPPIRAGNYIYHRGGVLRFGKLTMDDADLEIVGQQTRSPFDFYLDEYNRQLVAGYSKNTPSHGLVVYMPDYGQVASRG